jgi:hypothetical protein
MDSVGLTSQWVAAARARESKRLDRLFDDPLAAALAGSEGYAWLDHMERAQPWGQPALYVVVRTRFFDDSLLRMWSCVLRKPQGNEVPKVTEGCLGGFWHFWHPARLRILEFGLQKRGQYWTGLFFFAWGRYVQIPQSI